MKEKTTSLSSLIRDQVVFTREFINSFTSTGTMWSSSRWAAEAMTAPMRDNATDRPRKILEVGPGTGVITFRILKYMRNNDELVICEINPRFMEELKRNLSGNPLFEKHKDRVQFFTGAVQELPEEDKFDLIISAVPFLNFPIETTKEIFEKYFLLSKPETELTYYEYIGMRRLSKCLKNSARYQRVQRLEEFLSSSLPVPKVDRERVWCNLLPINVYRLQPSKMRFDTAERASSLHTEDSHNDRAMSI